MTRLQSSVWTGQSANSGGQVKHRPSSLQRGSWLILAVLFATFASVSPAWAHGAGETTEGYVLIQQALGNLAADPSDAGVLLAMEKVNDALATTDQEGVDVAAVQQAQTALEADHVDQARTLLQQSIELAVAALTPATGEETGTTLVLPPMPGRGDLTGPDWGLTTGALLLLLSGAALAFRFRPAENVTQLRRRLAVTTSRSSTPSVPTSADDATKAVRS